MPLAISITSVEAGSLGVMFVGFNLTPSGNYPAGGDTLDFTAVTQDANFSGLLAAIEASLPPTQLAVWSQNGNLLFQYAPIIGAALNNSKLKIGASATFGTELSAGAYPAGITGDKITGTAQFRKLL